MKLTKKNLSLTITTLLLLGSTFNNADPLSINLATYYIPSTYTSVAKTNTTVVGAYGFVGFGTSSLEGGYDQILGTNSKASVQQNYLGIYTYYLPTIKLKTGYVAIRTNGGDGNGDMGILSANYDQYNAYGYKEWALNTDLFVSQYTGSSKFSVIQISPGANYYMSAPWGVGWFDISGKINAINISDNRNLINEEIGAKYNWDSFSLGGTYYLGESTYGVYNGGFVVFNTNDKLQDGFALTGSYTLGPISLSLNYQFQNLKAAGASDKSSFTKIGGLLSYHF